MLAALAGFVLTAGPSGVNAFFRLPCSQPVVVERSDPIVNSGSISGHLHTIVGGSNFNFSMTYEDARASDCTSCKAAADKSNYWTPTLFYQAQDGRFQRVKQVGGMTVYYLQRLSKDKKPVRAFPPGFRMLAGDPFVRSYDNTNLAQRAVSHVCLGVPNSPQTPNLPNINCPEGVRTQLVFPSCWDGVNLDSTNHKSHVAYPDGMDNGKCPSTHPVRLVTIFYEVIWDTNAWKDQWWKGPNQQPFVLSMGDPTGYGFHGDFLNGWDVPALQRALDNCNQDSGRIEDCPGFIDLLTDQQTSVCVNPTRVNEVTEGWLNTLPGCNPVSPGPGRATPQSGCNGAGGNEKILSKDQVGFVRKDLPFLDPVGCAKDNKQARLLTGYSVQDLLMTIEKCGQICNTKGFSYIGLQWSIECWCGKTFDESKAATRGACNMPCGGNALEMCGGDLTLSVYRYNPNKSGTVPSPSPSTPANTPPPPPVNTPAASSSTTSTSTPPVVVVVPPPSSPSSRPASSSRPSPSSSPSSSPAPPPANTDTSTSVDPRSHGAPPGWNYRGCFVDTVHPQRTLAGAGQYNDDRMTPQVCVDRCKSKGFSVAGTEYGGECYCGDAMVGGALAKPDGECKMPCKGDKGVMCGGPARLSVYSIGMGKLSTRSELELGSVVGFVDADADVNEKRDAGNSSSVRRRSLHHRRSLHGRSRLSDVN
ncbi:hypothetical protein FRC16_000499 [Serendipita sp. 398]|nr:hypothetical protein FRC16_000499 [Serendipita sp. 398]